MQTQRLLQQGDKVRVLVVDDSVVLRRALSAALESDPDIEVVGVAASGELALQKVDQLNPDVVTLDVEMPGMNGLETLTQLKRRRPGLRVIMVSSLTARGAEVTMDALSRGADDYAAKPTTSSMEESIAILAEQLCPRVKQFFRLGLGVGRVRPLSGLQAQASSQQAMAPDPAAASSLSRAYSSPPGTTRSPGITRKQEVPEVRPEPIRPASLLAKDAGPEFRARLSRSPLEVIVIGISTGGPQALAEILPALGESFQLPLLIVQHMPVMFTRLLAERLNQQCQQNVREAEEGMSIGRGTITIAPGGFHMELRRGKAGLYVSLNQNAPENCCRPAADVLFRSVAAVCGSGSAAFVMTGMGQDGCAGARSMRASGAAVFAQDEASSVVWGMPGEVVRNGLADKVLSLAAIPEELRRLGYDRTRPRTSELQGSELQASERQGSEHQGSEEYTPQ